MAKLKLTYLEAKILEVTEINLSCLLLDILRDTDFAGKLSYDVAQKFIRNRL